MNGARLFDWWNRGRKCVTDIASGLACERCGAGSWGCSAGRRCWLAARRLFAWGDCLPPVPAAPADLHHCRILHLDLKVRECHGVH